MVIKKINIFSLIIVSILIITALSACNKSVENNKITKNKETSSIEKSIQKRQLRHVVLFKFKDSTSHEDIVKAEKAFIALPNKISEIKDFEWGTNNSPESLEKGFTHCFFLTFDNEEDRAIYLPHPDHKAFGEISEPILEDVLVIDYWVEK
jgi:hypothetical protein